MLSFSDFLKILMHKQSAKSLQVPCISPHKYYGSLFRPGKRVLPFTSAGSERAPASMTVEAALCLPLFLLFAVALMEPMRWLDRQRRVQTVTEQFCEELSQYMYAKELGETIFYGQDGSEPEEGDGVSDSRTDKAYLGALSDAAAGLWLKGKAEEYVDGVVIRKADVPDENGNVWIELTYREQIPFFHVKSGEISMHAAAKRRSWIGIDGKLKEKKADSSGAGKAGETIVYVGAGMGRYHMYRDCHYISNQYRTVPLSQAEQLRNASGGRYTACSRCAKAAGAAAEVYITEAGEHYHYSRTCSAMASYVRSVPLKEVEQLGVCSYCSRKRAGGE